VSGLLLRAAEEKVGYVVRSVGAPPNGYLVVVEPGGEPSWAVQPMGEPGGPGETGPLIETDSDNMSQATIKGVEEAASAVPVDLADVVAGLESALEAQGLFSMVAGMVVSLAPRAAQGNFEQLIRRCEFAVATRDALIEAGFLRMTDGGS
jgi:hypothetical protein